MKSILKYVAYLIGGLSTAYVVSMFFFSSLFSTSSQETWEAMHKSTFPCPEGTEITYRGWSKNGRQRYCEAVKNGPWEAWEAGYKNIRGAYEEGQKHGIWTWYHKDGRIYRTIEYKNGVELTNRIIEEK